MELSIVDTSEVAAGRTATEIAADELILQDLIAEPADRQRSYDRIAQAFERLTAEAQPSDVERWAAAEGRGS